MNFREELDKFKKLCESIPTYEADFPDLKEFEFYVNKFGRKKFPWWKKLVLENITSSIVHSMWKLTGIIYVDPMWLEESMKDMETRDEDFEKLPKDIPLSYFTEWNDMRNQVHDVFSKAYSFATNGKEVFFRTPYEIIVKPYESEKKDINEDESDVKEPEVAKKQFEISYKPSQDVKDLQKFLVYDKKYYIGKFGPNRDGVDGKYGPYTKAGHEAYLKGLSPKEFEQNKVKIAQEYIGDVNDSTLKNEFNFHLIPDGKNNYRSAQIPVSIKGKDYLGEVIDRYKIKTIIRFNGDGNDSRHQTNHPYTSIEDERNVAEQKGVSFYKLSSTRDQDKVNSLLSQGNVLIHCAHGADRTGGNVGGYLKDIGFGDTDKIWNYTTKYNGWNRMVNKSPNAFVNGGYLRQAQKFGVRDLKHAQELSNNK